MGRFAGLVTIKSYKDVMNQRRRGSINEDQKETGIAVSEHKT
jgi:hypothetical protein